MEPAWPPVTEFAPVPMVRTSELASVASATVLGAAAETVARLIEDVPVALTVPVPLRVTRLFERARLLNCRIPPETVMPAVPRADGVLAMSVPLLTATLGSVLVPVTRQVPVVMLTSSREETDLVRSYDLGVNAFVVKPVAFEEFFAAIKEIGVFWALLNEPPPYRGGWPSNA